MVKELISKWRKFCLTDCSIDLDERLQALKQKEDEDKKKRKERKKQKKEEKKKGNEKPEEDGDDDMAKMMGFSGFGSSKA